jgi:hypothetical protein
MITVVLPVYTTKINHDQEYSGAAAAKSAADWGTRGWCDSWCADRDSRLDGLDQEPARSRDERLDMIRSCSS